MMSLLLYSCRHLMSLTLLMMGIDASDVICGHAMLMPLLCHAILSLSPSTFLVSALTFSS